MKCLKYIGAFCACTLLAPLSQADSRIQQVPYDQTRVYHVLTKVGRTTLIQLEEGESLTVSPSSVLGMGDAAAWNVSARGNNIVFKPIESRPQTNMIVVTNKRTYSFDLEPTRKDDIPTYILRFQYPDTDAAKAAANAKRVQITAAAKAEKITINTSYVWRGENPLLKPSAAWDDGRFTRLVYDNAAELPQFYKVLPDGSEALINTSIDPADKKTFILQDVIRTARLRLGNEVIEVINKNYQQPKFNASGSSEYGSVRVEKGVPQ